MPGEACFGIDVPLEDLARFFPQHDNGVLVRSAAVVGSVVAASLGWSQAQGLGLAEQKRHGLLVQRLLDAASADVLRSAPQHVARLLAILSMCAQDLDPASRLAGLWRRRTKTGALQLHRQEIEQLKAKLLAAMATLEGPINEAMAIRGELTALAQDLLAASLACEWLSERDEFNVEVRSALLERSLSLRKTVALAHQQALQSTESATRYDALRDRIQDAVLVALPAWLATIAAQPDEPNETQRFVARDELTSIIDRLKH